MATAAALMSMSPIISRWVGEHTFLNHCITSENLAMHVNSLAVNHIGALCLMLSFQKGTSDNLEVIF